MVASFQQALKNNSKDSFKYNSEILSEMTHLLVDFQQCNQRHTFEKGIPKSLFAANPRWRRKRAQPGRQPGRNITILIFHALSVTDIPIHRYPSCNISLRSPLRFECNHSLQHCKTRDVTLCNDSYNLSRNSHHRGLTRINEHFNSSGR